MNNEAEVPQTQKDNDNKSFLSQSSMPKQPNSDSIQLFIQECLSSNTMFVQSQEITIDQQEKSHSAPYEIHVQMGIRAERMLHSQLGKNYQRNSTSTNGRNTLETEQNLRGISKIDNLQFIHIECSKNTKQPESFQLLQQNKRSYQIYKIQQKSQEHISKQEDSGGFQIKYSQIQAYQKIELLQNQIELKTKAYQQLKQQKQKLKMENEKLTLIKKMQVLDNKLLQKQNQNTIKQSINVIQSEKSETLHQNQVKNLQTPIKQFLQTQQKNTNVENFPISINSLSSFEQFTDKKWQGKSQINKMNTKQFSNFQNEEKTERIEESSLGNLNITKLLSDFPNNNSSRFLSGIEGEGIYTHLFDNQKIKNQLQKQKQEKNKLQNTLVDLQRDHKNLQKQYSQLSEFVLEYFSFNRSRSSLIV